MHHRFTSRHSSPKRDGNSKVPLNELTSGETGVVCNLAGGRLFKSRMVALGFTIGAHVTVIRNIGHGPVIISVLDTQIALGHHEAARVEVLPQ